MNILSGEQRLLSPFWKLFNGDARFGLYEEKDLDKDSKGGKEYKVMNQVSRQEAGTDICPGNVLQSINMDYAAFYGNPHLSNNMMEEDTEEEEEERTFSSHPYLIT